MLGGTSRAAVNRRPSGTVIIGNGDEASTGLMGRWRRVGSRDFGGRGWRENMPGDSGDWTDVRANDVRTEAGAGVDEEWPDTAMYRRASCTPLQAGKAWGNG